MVGLLSTTIWKIIDDFQWQSRKLSACQDAYKENARDKLATGRFQQIRGCQEVNPKQHDLPGTKV
jgi:hypothetical protein